MPLLFMSPGYNLCGENGAKTGTWLGLQVKEFNGSGLYALNSMKS